MVKKKKKGVIKFYKFEKNLLGTKCFIQVNSFFFYDLKLMVYQIENK